ncbi:MAG: hypothetical protein RLY20_3138 [Verrucomicrobiota bacterium]
MLLVLWSLAESTIFASDLPRSLYDGASVRFEQVKLLKPREQTNLGLAFTLAPLLIQEMRGRNAIEFPKRVFFASGTTTLNGRAHSQMTYWWRYEPPATELERRASPRRGPEARLLKRVEPDQSAAIRGLRITPNTKGSPAIYEVFGETRPVAQIFVAQSVEATARAEFGAALPGRRFAVERGLEEAPGIVVSRVLDEPGTVMGPIVYLTADTHDVATLICRCMESQAKTVVAQGFYELVPADFSGNVSAATRLEAAQPRWLREDFLTQTNRLSQSLRLPRDF